MKIERTLSVWRVVGGLIGWVAWMGVVFAGCMAWFDVRPTRGTARAFLALMWVSIAALALFTGGVLWYGARAADVCALLVVAWFLSGAAVAFGGAHRYSVRACSACVEGDPVAHWSHALEHGDRWTLRVRAARELGRLLPEHPQLRDLLRRRHDADSNYRVQDAVRRALST